MKKLILYDDDETPYFMLYKEKWYLNDISTDGFNLTMFTNCGYFGGWLVVGFEHDINDYAILKKYKPDVEE